MVAAGATRRVVNALTSHQQNEAVVKRGCWALAHLTSADQTCQELVGLDGVILLVRLLQTFPKEERLQNYALRALCNLSANGKPVFDE